MIIVLFTEIYNVELNLTSDSNMKMTLQRGKKEVKILDP